TLSHTHTHCLTHIRTHTHTHTYTHTYTHTHTHTHTATHTYTHTYTHTHTHGDRNTHTSACVLIQAQTIQTFLHSPITHSAIKFPAKQPLMVESIPHHHLPPSLCLTPTKFTHNTLFISIYLSI